MDIKRLLKPKAIAIVGANEKNGSFGNYSALNALQNSDDVHVYFVNAKKDFVLGRKAYKSLSDLPEVPDSIMLVTHSRTHGRSRAARCRRCDHRCCRIQ